MTNKKIKIIFDTNSCRSDASGHDHFFGYRKELERLAIASEVVIPCVVVDEIAAQKKRSLIKKRSEHLSNPFLKISGMDPQRIKEVDIDNIVKQLIASESINFTLRNLNDVAGALVKIYSWSIHKKPPFPPTDDAGDKGFKDAYIACIIEELLDEYDDEYFVFFTKDNLLIAKFRDHPRIKIVSDFNEIPKYVISAFLDEYLIKKVESEIELEDVNIMNSWLNIDDNWVLEVTKDGVNKLVIIDSQAREIIDTGDNYIDFFVTMLTSSGSFQQTHSAIGELTTILPFLSKKTLVDITEASIVNDQIFWVSKDEDVRQFYLPIFDVVKELLESEAVNKFNEYFVYDHQ